MESSIDVSTRVWERLLEVKTGDSCLCCGDFSESERVALDLYGPLARRDLGPYTVGQIGQSLDGRVATANGDSKQVSGPDGFQHLHRLRALVDGVIIGVKTALHDSPRLTVRHCEGEDPARIVIDPSGRLPNDSPVLEDNGARRIVIQASDKTRPSGVEVLSLQTKDGQFHPEEITAALHVEGLKHLLVEGGGFTLAKFIDAHMLQRIQISIAPLLIGAGPTGLNLQGTSPWLSQAIRPTTRAFSLGSDVVFDCGLNEDAERSLIPQHK